MFVFSRNKKSFEKTAYRITYCILKSISSLNPYSNKHLQIVSVPAYQQIQV